MCLRCLGLVLSVGWLIAGSGLVLANPAEDTVHAWFKALNSRPFDEVRVADLLSDELDDHNNEDLFLSDKAIQIYIQQEYAKGAPNARINLLTVEALKDGRVLAHWRFSGKHTAEMFEIPATNKPFDITGMTIFSVAEGKIIEVWQVMEFARLLEQLGVLDG